MTIRYKARSKPIRVNVSIDKYRATREEIALLLAEQTTLKYAQYLGGKKNMKELKRYQFGQYKLILHYLEKKI